MDVVDSDREEPSIREAFAGDHADLAGAFARYRHLKATDLRGATLTFRAFRHDLEHHMRREEKVLLAAIEQRLGSGAGPTAVMHTEHRGIVAALDRIAARLEAGDRDGDEEDASLLELLETHEFKEDQVLYPMVDRMLRADERRRLLAELAHVPVEGKPRCCG